MRRVLGIVLILAVTINLYGQKATEDSITRLYVATFDRAPDGYGESYWIEQLKEEEISKSLFILAVINRAVGDDATILENKTSVGLEFIKSASDNIK